MAAQLGARQFFALCDLGIPDGGRGGTKATGAVTGTAGDCTFVAVITLVATPLQVHEERAVEGGSASPRAVAPHWQKAGVGRFAAPVHTLVPAKCQEQV